MPRASQPRRLLPLALLLALAGGCTVDATGLRVTLRTGGLAVDHVAVTVEAPGRPTGSGEYRGTIDDGSTFGVQLPDSLDGQEVTVLVVARRLEATVGSGSGRATVVKHKAVELVVDLTAAREDLGIDAGRDLSLPDLSPEPDLRVADLARSDGPGDDLTLVDAGGDAAGPDDLAGSDAADGGSPDLLPDLAMPCVPSCNNSVAIVCDNNVQRQVNCSFGCNGAQCGGPNSCVAPGKIDKDGTYYATTAGARSTGVGSCNPAMGPDNTLAFTAQTWTKAIFSIDATFPATLFARQLCGDMQSEWITNGLCVPAALAPACSAKNAKGALTICGIPPGGQAFLFVQDAGGMGGNYAVTATYTRQSLQTCQEAGMLPGQSFSFQGLDTSLNQDKNQAAMGAPNCGDLGVGSPDMVFWVPVGAANDGKLLTVKVTSQGALQPLVYIQTYCAPASTVCFLPVNGVTSASVKVAKDGAYFVFVDGLNKTSGKFNIDMAFK